VTQEVSPKAVAACGECKHEIDRCAFCDNPECPVAVCYRCINSALKQTLLHPHLHGG
jgi:hypothetical protein